MDKAAKLAQIAAIAAMAKHIPISEQAGKTRKLFTKFSWSLTHSKDVMLDS